MFPFGGPYPPIEEALLQFRILVMVYRRDLRDLAHRGAEKIKRGFRRARRAFRPSRRAGNPQSEDNPPPPDDPTSEANLLSGGLPTSASNPQPEVNLTSDAHIPSGGNPPAEANAQSGENPILGASLTSVANPTSARNPPPVANSMSDANIPSDVNLSPGVDPASRPNLLPGINLSHEINLSADSHIPPWGILPSEANRMSGAIPIFEPNPRSAANPLSESNSLFKRNPPFKVKAQHQSPPDAKPDEPQNRERPRDNGPNTSSSITTGTGETRGETPNTSDSLLTDGGNGIPPNNLNDEDNVPSRAGEAGQVGPNTDTTSDDGNPRDEPPRGRTISSDKHVQFNQNPVTIQDDASPLKVPHNMNRPPPRNRTPNPRPRDESSSSNLGTASIEVWIEDADHSSEKSGPSHSGKSWGKNENLDENEPVGHRKSPDRGPSHNDRPSEGQSSANAEGLWQPKLRGSGTSDSSVRSNKSQSGSLWKGKAPDRGPLDSDRPSEDVNRFRSSKPSGKGKSPQKDPSFPNEGTRGDENRQGGKEQGGEATVSQSQDHSQRSISYQTSYRCKYPLYY
ncbi:hypothetical protein BDW62DRAFT_198583 [Aspergillus aurantiobrunneus]